MKLISKAIAAALVGFATLLAPAAQAQVNLNISPPSWGPAVPAGAQYYYIPETGGFYDVPARQYVVQRNGNWVRTSAITGYNPRNFHPVVVDYVGAQPWERHEEYRTKYPKKAHPHGMPPGQAKKQGYQSNPSNGGRPPGQAKQQNRNGNGVPAGHSRDDHDEDDRKHKNQGQGKGKGHNKN